MIAHPKRLRLCCWLTVLLAVCSFVTVASAKVVEPRTGIAFDEKFQHTKLAKLGLRSKGPIKVYAVGQYGKYIFMLKMAYSVNAEKMSDALLDALRPRCKQQKKADECSEKMAEFKEVLMAALPKGASKGTELVFGTSGGKVTIKINGKAKGQIASAPLANSFAGIYTDDKAVCKLKEVGAQDEDNDFWKMVESLVPDLEDPKVVMTIVALAATSLYMLFVFVLSKASGTHRRKAIVTEVDIYPIKSCAEQRVMTATVAPGGFEGDRVAMVIDAQNVCCTPRNPSHVRLFKIAPTYDATTKLLTLKVNDPFVTDTFVVDTTKASPVPKVQHNEAPHLLQLDEYGNKAAGWLQTETGIVGARLVGIGADYKRHCRVNPAQEDPVPTKDNAPVSLADEAPLLLTSEASLEDLNRHLKIYGSDTVDMRRFRPNIVVSGTRPWEEDMWKKIRIGPRLEFFVWQRCGRCVMTTIDRDTLERCGEPLNTLSTFRERKHGMRNFGMHLIPDPSTLSDVPEENTISEQDVIQVLEYDIARRKEWTNQFGS